MTNARANLLRKGGLFLIDFCESHFISGGVFDAIQRQI